jgi:hypothetical protein
MPWGKHKGQDLADVPESYLQWALENAEAMSPTLREAIRARLGLPPTPPDGQAVAAVVGKVHDVLRDVYRKMSMRFHPDRGGSTAAMAAINHMNDCLIEAMTRNLPVGATDREDSPF